jgi:hypothetical protein
MMFKRIVMQVSGRVMVQFTVAYLLLTTCLSKTAKHLLALITQTYHSVLTPLNPLAKMLPSFKAWAVNPTTVAPSTKQGRSTAKAKATQTGSQRQTTVHQIRQHVATAIKKINALVALMKLVASHINVSKTAWTRIVHQWIQAGLRLLGRVNLRLLVAYLSQRLERVRVTLTSWVLLAIKKLAVALTLMGNQLKVIGLKLQGSVHLLLQPVLRLQSLIKKRAEKTKLVQSLLKKAVAVLTRMVYLLKVIGLKQVGTVRQPQQPAQRRRLKGR